MSEMTIGILSMPDELFWDDSPLTRIQHNAAREEAVAEITRLKADANRLAEAALAYQELSTCYRVGKQPTEKLFKRLEQARAALAAHERGEG